MVRGLILRIKKHLISHKNLALFNLVRTVVERILLDKYWQTTIILT
jgi:hypothetical protein